MTAQFTYTDTSNSFQTKKVNSYKAFAAAIAGKDVAEFCDNDYLNLATSQFKLDAIKFISGTTISAKQQAAWLAKLKLKIAAAKAYGEASLTTLEQGKRKAGEDQFAAAEKAYKNAKLQAEAKANYTPNAYKDWVADVLDVPRGELCDNSYANADVNKLNLNNFDEDSIQQQLWMSQLQLKMLTANAKAAKEQKNTAKQNYLAAIAQQKQVYKKKIWANRLGEFFSYLYGIAQGMMVAGFFIMLVGFEAAVKSDFLLSFAIVFGGVAGLANYFMIRREMPTLVHAFFFDRNKKSSTSGKTPGWVLATAVGASLLIAAFTILGSIELMQALSEWQAGLISHPEVEGMEIVNTANLLHNGIVYGIPALLTFFMVLIPEAALNRNQNKIFFKKENGEYTKFKDIVSFLKNKKQAVFDKITNNSNLNPDQKNQLKWQYNRDFWMCTLGMLATSLVCLQELSGIVNVATSGALPGFGFAFFVLLIGTLCSLPFYLNKAATGVEREINRIEAEQDARPDPTKLPNGFNFGLRYPNSVGQALPAFIPMIGISALFIRKMPYEDGVSWGRLLDVVSNGSPIIAPLIITCIFAAFIGACAMRASQLGNIEGPVDMYPVKKLHNKIKKEEGELLADSQTEQATATQSRVNFSYDQDFACNFRSEQDLVNDLEAVNATTARM